MNDPDAHRLALLLAEAAIQAKAEEVVLLEVGELTPLAHYFLVCHGTSDRHVRSIAERIEEAGREAGETIHHREGQRDAKWALLDFSDVVIHVFDPETRERYRLEDLWADAPRVDLDVAA